jgi:hypothetical protein
MKKSNRLDKCKCGHVRATHDSCGCLSTRCWSPLGSPNQAKCNRFRKVSVFPKER